VPAEDLVDRDFNPDAPNVLWSSDFTYIRTGEGWLYLAGVLDCFSRRLVGWSMAGHMREELVTDALNMAVARRRPGEGLVHHSDRGSHGGAYDAALARGHTPRSAMDLMIAHDLTDRRTQTTGRQPAPSTIRRLRADQATVPAAPERAARARFTIAERDIQRWQQAFTRRPGLLEALTRDHGWSYQTIRELELGFDQLGQRITIPIRDPDGQLQGLLRYDPSPNRRGPKMRAAPGTRLGLVPHPDRVQTRELLLCEGPSDMLAARSARLPAIAVPSATAWRAEWTEYFQGRSVTIAMHADPAGRHAARTIAHDLTDCGIPGHAIDVAPRRNDGYDLSDWLADHPGPATAALLRELTSPLDPSPQLHEVAQPMAHSLGLRRAVAHGGHTLAPARRVP